MRVILRRAWNDSVWSKVIAAGITGAVAGVGTLAVKQWPRLSELGGKVGAMLGGSIPVPAWLVLGAATLPATLLVVVFLQRRRNNDRPSESVDVQPNAIPIALVPLEPAMLAGVSRHRLWMAMKDLVGTR
jgi:predicted branched-subunit amino acid permease